MSNSNAPKTHKLLAASVKIGLSAGALALIAWAVVGQGTPEHGVQSAQADIISLDFFGPRSKSQQFGQTLKEFQFEKPRMYSWNDNTFFYSMAQTDASPREFLSDFQQKLVENDVNQRSHTSIPPALEEITNGAKLDTLKRADIQPWTDQQSRRLDDFFSGGLIPTEISDTHVTMVGAQSPESAKDAHSYIMEQIKHGRSVEESASLMRYVEAWREPGDHKTTIAAVWSDKDLDMSKFTPQARADLSTNDRQAPACIGCDKTMTFRGSGAEKDYGTDVFVGQRNVRETMHEYDRLMADRGWKLSEATQMVRLLEDQGVVPPESSQISSFSKGSKFITVMAYPLEQSNQTQIHVFSSR